MGMPVCALRWFVGVTTAQTKPGSRSDGRSGRRAPTDCRPRVWSATSWEAPVAVAVMTPRHGSISAHECGHQPEVRVSGETPFVDPWRAIGGWPSSLRDGLPSFVGVNVVRRCQCRSSSAPTRWRGPGSLRALHIDASSLRQGWQRSREAGEWSGPESGRAARVRARALLRLAVCTGLVVAHPAGQAVPEHVQPAATERGARRGGCGGR